MRYSTNKPMLKTSDSGEAVGGGSVVLITLLTHFIACAPTATAATTTHNYKRQAELWGVIGLKRSSA